MNPVAMATELTTRVDTPIQQVYDLLSIIPVMESGVLRDFEWESLGRNITQRYGDTSA